MLARQNRFHGPQGLKRLYRRSSIVRGSLFSVRIVRGLEPSGYRAAVVVSKKVSKSAVIRNRIRRRVYEALSAQDPARLAGYDVMITVFQDSVTMLAFGDLKNELTRQLSMARKRAKSQNSPPTS